MAETATRVSKALEAVIGANTLECLAGRPRLGARDLETLRALLAGKVAAPSGFSRKRALSALAAADPGPETAALLGRQLSDPKTLPRDRRLAAALLADMPGEVAEVALLAALPESKGTLRHELLTALARAGGLRAREALGRLPKDSADPELDRLVAFADLAIAVRAGENPEPSAIGKALDHHWEPVRVELLAPERIRAADAVIEGARFGVIPGRRVGFAFRCGRLESMVLFDAAFDKGALPDVLRARARVAGLVAEEEPAAPRRTIRMVVMTIPHGDQVRILVVTPGGRLLFEGEAVPQDSGLVFRLRDTAQARGAAAIEGLIGRDKLDVSIRAAREAPRPKRRPVAVSAHPVPPGSPKVASTA